MSRSSLRSMNQRSCCGGRRRPQLYLRGPRPRVAFGRRCAARRLLKTWRRRASRSSFRLDSSTPPCSAESGALAASPCRLPCRTRHRSSSMSSATPARSSSSVTLRRSRTSGAASREHCRQPIPCRWATHSCAEPRDRLPHIGAQRRAMIVYTSGTTGRPKGVVTTHAIIGAEVGAHDRSLGVASHRSHAADASAAPCARHHERTAVRASRYTPRAKSCPRSTR